MTGPANRAALWLIGGGVSVAAHLGVLAALSISVRPDPVPDQPIPNSQLEMQAYQVRRSQARPAQPETRTAPAADASGTRLDAEAVRQTTARPVRPAQTALAASRPDAPTLAAHPPGGTALPGQPAPIQAVAEQTAAPTPVAATPATATVLPPRPTPATALRPQPADLPPIQAAQVRPDTLRAARVAASTMAAASVQAARLSATAPPSERITPRPPAPQVLAVAAATARPLAAVTQPARPAAQVIQAAMPLAQARPQAAPLAAAAPATSPAPQAEAPATPAPALPPPALEATAMLAFDAGAGDQVDPVSVLAFQSFTQTLDATRTSGARGQLRDGVAQLLDRVPCSRLQVSFDPDTATLLLNGHVPEDGLRAPVLQALQAQVGANIRVTDNLRVLPRPQCGVLSGIAALGLAASTDQNTDPRLLGKNTQVREFRFREGQRLVLDLGAPDYDSFVYVDYYDATGQVIHLVPNQVVPLERHTAKTSFQVGAERAGKPSLNIAIGPPFGQEIAVAFAASEPLYDGVRPLVEPAGPYLEWLRERIAQARATVPDFKGEWVYFFVVTRPR